LNPFKWRYGYPRGGRRRGRMTRAGSVSQLSVLTASEALGSLPLGRRPAAVLMGSIPRSAARPRPSAKATRTQFLKAARCLRLDEERHDLRARRAHPFLQSFDEVFDRGRY
jgi:hypothetical protein